MLWFFVFVWFCLIWFLLVSLNVRVGNICRYCGSVYIFLIWCNLKVLVCYRYRCYFGVIVYCFIINSESWFFCSWWWICLSFSGSEWNCWYRCFIIYKVDFNSWCIFVSLFCIICFYIFCNLSYFWCLCIWCFVFYFGLYFRILSLNLICICNGILCWDNWFYFYSCYSSCILCIFFWYFFFYGFKDDGIKSNCFGFWFDYWYRFIRKIFFRNIV